MGKKPKNETTPIDTTMTTLIDFSDPYLRTFLPVLLQDHTTGRNIMDGLKKTVPSTDIPCKIKDWKADKEILFKDVGEDD